VRVTSLPVAHPIAMAVVSPTAALLVLLAIHPAASAARWQRPVPGEVTRAFSYSPARPFDSGAHRGVDLAARAGAPVRAACAGRVVHAGSVPGQASAVSLRCGRRRVTHLPLGRVTVREGDAVGAGARLGTLAGGHGGLHLGVRVESDPFGYEDPALVLPRAEPFDRTPPAVGPAPRPRPLPRSLPALRPAARRLAARDPVAVPWPVWAGLAALLSGVARSGARHRHRRAGASTRSRPSPARRPAPG
jgi:hypothetical protein